MSYAAPALTIPVVLTGGYAAPALTIPVVLTGGYTAPALTIPVVLGGEPASDVAGTLAADLPVTLPALTLSAAGFVGIPGTLTADLPVALPDLTFSASGLVVDIVMGALAASLPLPTLDFSLAATGTQDLQLLTESDGPRCSLAAQHGIKASSGATLPHQQALPLQHGLRMPIASADPIRVGASLLQQAMIPLHRGLANHHQHGLKLGHGAAISHAETLRTQRALSERAAHGLKLGHGAALPHAETIKLNHRLKLRDQQALPWATPLRIGQQQARTTATCLTILWQQADKPKPGRWWPRYEPPPLNIPIVLCGRAYTVRPLRCAVVLSWEPVQQPYCPGIDPSETVVVPILRIYRVINTFSLVRADNGQAVDALDFSATLSADAWTWSWSATVPASQMSRVRSTALGEFVELIATLNGTAIRVVVENLIRSRKFGSAALSISGRGRAAWLADPHSLIQTTMNTETRTAQQLLADALTLNGVSIGWGITWQAEDWPVAAGLWSQTGTYIEAANRIAASAGGYVQPHDTDQTLIIKPYYPSPPWAWAAATPDIQLPEDVCVTEGIEWKDSPAYNAVWIVGGTGGRRDKIKRAGTAGDRHAPTVVDPLATDTVMTRQRGLRVIADTGRQASISLNLPILAATGIIKPGKLIRYTEQGQTHLGLSRAVSVRYQFPTASQTVTVETHVLESV